MLAAAREGLEAFVHDYIPFCRFTLRKFPRTLLVKCRAVGYDRLSAWAREDPRHYVEVDKGGLYMRFSGERDYRRIRIRELLEEPFDDDGRLRPEYEARVYKPILLTKRRADGRRVMSLDRGLRVEYYEQPDFPEWMSPFA
jgi:hypothetical protein